MENLGTNVEFEVEDGVLRLEVDLTEEGQESSSGKSVVLSSTRGNKTVEYNGEDVFVGLNVYKRKKKGD